MSLFAADVPERQPQVTRVVRTDPRTGRLVRRVMVTSKRPAPPKSVATVGSVGIAQAVDQIAAEHALPPLLIHSVIKVESDYDPNAVSPKGALGLMQLMPDTARRLGVADVFDPVDNIRGGAKYLRHLLDLYNGNYPLALAAYNAGEAAVQKYGTVPPYAETLNYLTRIERLRAAGLAARPSAGAQPAHPVAAEPLPAGPAHIQEIVGSDGAVRYVSR